MASFADVELRHLAALCAIAEEGTFGRAARRLGFSQAAISQQVAGLERAAGTPVFDRPGGPRPVSLTPAGLLLLRHAKEVLSRIEQAGVELAQLRAGTGGTLVVGTFQSISVRLLPGVVARLKSEAPDLDIRVVQRETSAELVAGLVEGTIGVTFLDTPIDHPDVRLDLVLRDPFVVVVPSGDEIAAELPPGAPYPLAALADRPMVGYNVCEASTRTEAELAAHDVTPRYAFRTEDNGALQAMVRAGMGWALMPLLAVDETDPGVAIRLTEPAMPLRDVLVARRRDAHTTAAADRFAVLAVQLGGGTEIRPDVTAPAG